MFCDQDSQAVPFSPTWISHLFYHGFLGAASRYTVERHVAECSQCWHTTDKRVFTGTNVFMHP